MFKTRQIAGRPLRLATFTNRCAKDSDADMKACGMWDSMFQHAVALATWDVDSTEWAVKDPEDFIKIEHGVKILLIKFLDVNVAPGLGEAIMVMDQQRLDAGEHILPDEDTSEVRPHWSIDVVYNANKHHRATWRAEWTTLRSTLRATLWRTLWAALWAALRAMLSRTLWAARRTRRWTRPTRRSRWPTPEGTRGRRTRPRTSQSSPGRRTREAIKTCTQGSKCRVMYVQYCHMYIVRPLTRTTDVS